MYATLRECELLCARLDLVKASIHGKTACAVSARKPPSETGRFRRCIDVGGGEVGLKLKTASSLLQGMNGGESVTGPTDKLAVFECSHAWLTTPIT